MPETETETETEPVTDPATDSKNFAKLRKHAESVEAENVKLRMQVVKSQAAAEGFDTKSGLFDLVAERFMTQVAKDPEASFKEFAEGLGMAAHSSETPNPSDPTQPPPGEDPPPAANDPVAKQLAAMQANQDLLRKGSTSPIPASIDEQIANAEAEHNVAASIALKRSKYFDNKATVPT